MNNLCLVNHNHPHFERFCYFVLTLLFCSSAIRNIMMTLQVIPCTTTPEFMMLTENIWVISSWIGRVIFTFMEYFYAGINPIILVVSCFSVLDVMMIFGTILMLQQYTERKAAVLRKKTLLYSSSIRLIALAALLVFVAFTLLSLTTQEAFSNLRIGTVIYGIGNLFSIVPLLVGIFSINN